MCGPTYRYAPEHPPRNPGRGHARRLSGVDPAAYEALLAYFGERSLRLGDNNLAHALVRPAGVAGAVVSGFWSVAPVRHPDRIRVFGDAAEAMRWLGRDEGVELLDRLHAGATNAPRLVQALRDQLAARPRRRRTPHPPPRGGGARARPEPQPAAGPRGRLTDLARRRGVSTRALQEQLQAAGTTYRDEVAAARIRAAKSLLLESDRKLGAIALEVGCASLQHFSTLFRRAVGEAPSAWRARHRGG